MTDDARRVHQPFSNQLTDAESERLALLAEECAEVIQVIGKVLRHGFESHDPTKEAFRPTNRELLEAEIGHVRHAIDRMTRAHDVNKLTIRGAKEAKANRIRQWLHHQQESR